MRNHYQRILQDSDDRVRRFLEVQILDPSSPFYGGFPKADSLAEPKTAIYRATTMTACLLNPDSRYYLDGELTRRLELALAFVRRSQRPGGYFDLINCNFYSGPDTAFCAKRLIPAYVYLKKVEAGELYAADDARARAAALRPVYEEILRDAAEALCHCGFHTPNHRWAIASVLMLCAVLFDKPACRTAAEAILQEGSDCNADGEYAERSAGNYNRINNDAMIMLAVATGDKTYYEPVLRNLEMMLTYIDPDDSIFTSNSTRWDRGRKIYPREYYLEYLYMGHTCARPDLLDAANEIMRMVDRHHLRSFDCLIQLMLQPALIELEHEGCATPADYHKFYEGSGILRCRRGGWSYTLLNHSPSFLFFQNGDFCLNLRIGASFCEHRNFTPETLEPAAGGYALHQTMTGWYYLPFAEKPATSDWWQMDHTRRQKLYGPDMVFDVTVTEVENGIDVHIRNTGIDRAPLRVELAFDAGCRVETEAFTLDGADGSGVVAKQGTLTASKGDFAIQAGPCFGAHNYTAGKEGSLGRVDGCFTVYLTDYSCFEHTISLRALPSAYDQA